MQNPTLAWPGKLVLVVGEALIDIINTAGKIREHAGGSPANVALGLARLGMATSFLTALGRDARGGAIADRLHASGVEILPESWSLSMTSTEVMASAQAKAFSIDRAGFGCLACAVFAPRER